MATTAPQILAAYWDGTVPVPIESFAPRLGAVVRTDEALPDLGLVEWLPNQSFPIAVRTQKCIPQRFTLAHLLGHLALGHLTPLCPVFREEAAHFKTETYPLEQHANQFALELLMPARVVSFAITDRGYATLEALAALFGVSEVAMKWRLQGLGII